MPFAVDRQYVEGVELHVAIVFAGVEGVEVGGAVQAENHRLAIQYEPLLLDLARGLHDPRIPIGPVMSAPGDQAHAVTVPQPEPIPVVLDLVEPTRPLTRPRLR
jgi:hypothetical protein